MIRYPITRKEIEFLIDKEKPTWRSNAQKRQDDINSAQKYDEPSSIWSDIKDVYRRLQKQKCAFCERQLAGEPHGSIEHDVEHFRPKKASTKWAHPRVDKTWHRQGRTDGYYWLAYDIFNYATSCKVCNTPLKGNRFPIAKQPGKPVDSIDDLNKAEEPLLIYPISDKDDDPEDLIRFEGILAVPVEKDSALHPHRRAAVTIEFFALNEREELQRDRAKTIMDVWSAIEKINSAPTPEQRNHGRDDLAMYTSQGHPHTNCARSFARMCEDDPMRAWQIYIAARQTYQMLVLGGKVS